MGNQFRLAVRGRRLTLIIGAASLGVFIPTIISGMTRKWLWMRQHNDVAILRTLFSVNFPMFCMAFAGAFLCLRVIPHLAAKKRRRCPQGQLGMLDRHFVEERHLAFARWLDTGYGSGQGRCRLLLCAHVPCAMGYVSSLSLGRIPYRKNSSHKTERVQTSQKSWADRPASPARRGPIKSARGSSAAAGSGSWPLRAGTSTESPDYRDVEYVGALTGPGAVNTAPLETLDGCRDHGEPKAPARTRYQDARRVLARRPERGTRIDNVTRQLEGERVEKFNKPFDKLMAAWAQRSPRPLTREP